MKVGTFGDEIQMGDVMNTSDRVLQVCVRGRAYSATQLKQWVMEICGQVLTELPSVVTLSRGWFTL